MLNALQLEHALAVEIGHAEATPDAVPDVVRVARQIEREHALDGERRGELGGDFATAAGAPVCAEGGLDRRRPGSAALTGRQSMAATSAARPCIDAAACTR